MASLMVVITAVLFLLQKWYVNKKSFTMSAMRPIQPTRAKGAKNVIMHVFTYLLVILSEVPHLVIIWTSLRKTEVQYFVDGYSFESYTKIFDTALSSIQNTYLYCIIALAIIIVLGMLIAYLSVRKKSMLTSAIDTIAMFPYIIPGSVLGITLLLAFNGKGDPMVLSGTAAIMIISLVIRRLAYTLRSSSAILYQISRRGGRHLSGRFAAEGLCEGNGQADAARRNFRRHPELDHAYQRAELLGHALHGKHAHHVRGHLQRGYPRQLWHGRRAGHHPYADDGAVAVPVFQDQRKQGCHHVVSHLSQARRTHEENRATDPLP